MIIDDNLDSKKTAKFPTITDTVATSAVKYIAYEPLDGSIKTLPTRGKLEAKSTVVQQNLPINTPLNITATFTKGSEITITGGNTISINPVRPKHYTFRLNMGTVRDAAGFMFLNVFDSSNVALGSRATLSTATGANAVNGSGISEFTILVSAPATFTIKSHSKTTNMNIGDAGNATYPTIIVEENDI